MRNLRRVLVNPGAYRGGGYLKVEDAQGRVIPFTEEGTSVPLSTHISRFLKCGDLVLVVSKKVKTKTKQEG